MSPDPDFKDLSLDEMLKKQKELETFIAKRLEMKKKEALHQIQTIVRQHELSYEEVVAVIRTTTRRGKAPAIYRNPTNPRQTWSGKGEPPSWYVNAKDKEALRIPGS
jgi:DNA-binding protein H-NS